jgi:4'-phosphopantetheinyl transferase EntD
MIGEVLPPPVAAAEVFGNPPGATLFPEEEAAVSKAVEKRRQEFTAVRYCARAAMARLGLPAVPIVPGPRGAPQWPPGVVGSMTHCPGYRAAAVARVSEVITLGLDAEPHEALPPEVHGLVTIPAERSQLTALAAAVPSVAWDRVLFSVKESVYKAWFPLMRCWLGFEEACVSIDPADGTFSARLLVDGPVLSGRRLDAFTGSWLVRNGLIVTAVCVYP